jgi:hypothetical protein
MNTVSERTVERTWSQVNDATPEDVQALMDRMMAEQPFAGAYLLAVEEVWIPEGERGGLLLIGLIVWRAMSSGAGRIRAVTAGEIESAEALNIEFLEQLEDGSEMQLTDALERLSTTYHQAPLLRAVLEALMQDHAGDMEETPDRVGMAFLHLKTVLDCLHQAALPAQPPEA